MKKPVITFCSLIFLLFITDVSAQSKKAIKDSSTVIIFNQSSTSSYKKSHSGETNIIKIAPLGFISGTFPLLFERRITDFLSIQAAGGLTSKNYVRGTITKEANPAIVYPWTDDRSDESEQLYSFTYRKAKLGFMASIQPRIYFESEGLDGNFVGLSFDYYRYNFETPSLSGTNGNFKQDGPLVNEFENIKDFMVHFGRQTLYDRISMEYTTAIGLRNVSGSKYAAGYDYNTNQLSSGNATYKQTLLNFNIGVKVGYHF